jgi:hypothetical protein
LAEADSNKLASIEIIASPATAGTYTLTTGLPNNDCYGTASVEIIVLPAVENNVIESSQTICSGISPAMLTGSLPTGGNGTYTYFWERNTSIDGTGPFSPALGTNNEQNYSPGNISQKTFFRRKVQSCTGGTFNISNVVEISLVGSPFTGPSDPVGELLPCAGRGDYIYTTTAQNAISYEWTVSDPDHTITGSGTSATASFSHTGTVSVEVTAHGCNGITRSAATKVEVVFCNPFVNSPIEFGCPLTGLGERFCYISLSDICRLISLDCICSSSICEELRRWKFRPDDLKEPIRMELIAAVSPEKLIRVLASSVYRNKSIEIPVPKHIELKSDESLWLRFSLMEKSKNDLIQMVMEKDKEALKK